MITYNKAKPASNEMSDYKRVPRTDDFSWDLSFLQSSQLLREPCQLYHHQCKWHFKESLQWAGNANADQRCCCSAHFSQKLWHLSCVCSLGSDCVIFWWATGAPSAFVSPASPLRKAHFHHQSSVECSRGSSRMNSCTQSVILRRLLVFVLDRLVVLK